MLADMINRIVDLGQRTADFKRTHLPGNRVQVRSPSAELLLPTTFKTPSDIGGDGDG